VHHRPVGIIVVQICMCLYERITIYNGCISFSPAGSERYTPESGFLERSWSYLGGRSLLVGTSAFMQRGHEQLFRDGTYTISPASSCCTNSVSLGGSGKGLQPPGACSDRGALLIDPSRPSCPDVSNSEAAHAEGENSPTTPLDVRGVPGG
jgi:hypothetical protein